MQPKGALGHRHALLGLAAGVIIVASLLLVTGLAVARLATGFVDRLNGRRAADAVEMICPDKRRLIRDAVVWTAMHRPHLRITTRFKNAVRPGYVTIAFDGTVGGHKRRGTFGLDADRAGRPVCVSAFYSVG